MAGILLMIAFVSISLGLLLLYAGRWGVPFFSFTTDRGSACTNNVTGYTCDQLTLADVEFYGEVDLPDDTVVVEGVYRSTHDFTLDAELEVPSPSAGAALTKLNEAYGPCRENHPLPLSNGLSGACVMANDDAVTTADDVGSRLFTVGTGVRKDGVRLVTLSIRSR